MEAMILAEVEFEKSPIPDGCFRSLIEVTVKRDGCVWRIHKNDADPFPSNPHAHNVESGLKLDLKTGDLYWRRNPTGKKITPKNLEYIREQVVLKGIAVP